MFLWLNKFESRRRVVSSRKETGHSKDRKDEDNSRHYRGSILKMVELLDLRCTIMFKWIFTNKNNTSFGGKRILCCHHEDIYEFIALMENCSGMVCFNTTVCGGIEYMTVIW